MIFNVVEKQSSKVIVISLAIEGLKICPAGRGVINPFLNERAANPREVTNPLHSPTRQLSHTHWMAEFIINYLGAIRATGDCSNSALAIEFKTTNRSAPSIFADDLIQRIKLSGPA